MKKKYKELLEKLKNKEIRFYDIPESDRSDFDFIAACCRSKINTFCNRGYDVIDGSFFVEVYDKENGLSIERFDSFDSFYEFLEGDIYPCSCYFQYHFSSIEIEKYGIELSKINFACLTPLKCADITPEKAYTVFAASEKEEEREQQKEKRTKAKLQSIRVKYEEKICSITDYEVFCDQINLFKKEHDRVSKEYSAYSSVLDIIRKYMETHQENGFEIVMKYISENLGFPYRLIPDLFYFYNPDSVLEAYRPTSAAKSTNSKYRGKMRECVNEYKTNPEKYKRATEVKAHTVSENNADDNTLTAAYDQDFIVFHSGYDSSKHIFGVEYNGSYSGNLFNGNIIFHFFFDFVAFFDGKLSGADLLFCDGLSNLLDWSNIDFSDARLTSKLQEKFGLAFTDEMILRKSPQSFPLVLKNEKETLTTLIEQRQTDEDRTYSHRLYYVSDLHLIHQLNNAGCRTNNDIIYFISILVQQIKHELSDFQFAKCLLIGGDIASDFSIYALFIGKLREEVKYIPIIVTLGNHELWSFPDKTYEEIVEIYRSFLSEQHIFLLENDLICDFGLAESPRFVRFTEKEILSMSPVDLHSRLSRARMILFGGLGFAGLNEEFNANNGIYRSVITREQEITESERIDKLYSVVSEVLSDKSVIICTHNPLKDWSHSYNPHKGFYYVSGHTHKNNYYDDGVFHIFSDNQIGYTPKQIHLKYFNTDGTYDLFSDWKDGIYEITRKQYIDFNQGKYLYINFNGEYRKLFMLKKSGFYMFILETLAGNLCLLNGGATKKLDEYDVKYYYDKMDIVVSFLKKPIDQFGLVLKRVSQAIKQIGGSGHIHGCIVDIDFYNHVYVNHLDLSLTGYWAWDMVDKEAYSSVPSLLKQRCPELYDRYQKMLTGEQSESLALIRSDNTDLDTLPIYYPSTDIYKSSRYIKKLQRLNSNILAEWREPEIIAIENL